MVKAGVCKTPITGSNPVVASNEIDTKPAPHGAGFASHSVEATTGFEPVIGVLQTPALTTWLRRLGSTTNKGGTTPPLVGSSGAEEGI